MITRFRIEVDGISHSDCNRQLEEVVLAIFDLNGSNREDWEITDDVGWFQRVDNVYNARIVMKLKGNNG